MEQIHTASMKEQFQLCLSSLNPRISNSDGFLLRGKEVLTKRLKFKGNKFMLKAIFHT